MAGLVLHMYMRFIVGCGAVISGSVVLRCPACNDACFKGSHVVVCLSSTACPDSIGTEHGVASDQRRYLCPAFGKCFDCVYGVCAENESKDRLVSYTGL